MWSVGPVFCLSLRQGICDVPSEESHVLGKGWVGLHCLVQGFWGDGEGEERDTEMETLKVLQKHYVGTIEPRRHHLDK